MMLSLKGVRDYIGTFALTDDNLVYIGKLDNKREHAIGVYPRATSGQPVTPLGGYQNGSYEMKPISILIHWSKSKEESEQMANKLFERLKQETKVTINNVPIRYIRFMVPEPQDVGTDDKGVYEYVIWLDLIYNKEVSQWRQ